MYGVNGSIINTQLQNIQLKHINTWYKINLI